MAVIGGSTPIKSIQRGTTSVSKGATVTATINSVDVTKTMIVVSTTNGWQNGHSSGYYAGTASITAGVVLTNGTTLTLIAGSGQGGTSAGNGPCSTDWEVVEYV
jgi:hypothetical protein|tara:strand:+ start:209 stop:520 length:312 start_codon:yes stop_codon:yes gene_type:complete